MEIGKPVELFGHMVVPILSTHSDGFRCLHFGDWEPDVLQPSAESPNSEFIPKF